MRGVRSLSVILPARDESRSVELVLRELLGVLQGLPGDHEVIVVDDGSRDDTAARAGSVPGVQVLRNPINLGYGHSLLRGIAHARGEVIGISDADGSYPMAELPALLELMARGADHAIAQRTGPHFSSHYALRFFYRALCRYVVGQPVPDANSGMRLFRREVVDLLRGDLCRGFSFTTSLTLASILTGAVVVFHPVPYAPRTGRSHVRARDFLRTLQYLFQLVALYNPLKLFLPLVLAGTALAAVSAGAAAATANITYLACAMVAGCATLILIGLSATTYVLSRLGLFPVRGRSSPPGFDQSEPPADR